MDVMTPAVADEKCYHSSQLEAKQCSVNSAGAIICFTVSTLERKAVVKL